MTHRQTAALAFRVLGLYLFITQLSWVFMGSSFLFSEDQGFSFLAKVIQIFGYCLALATAALVWRFADLLADRVTAGSDPREPATPPGAEDLRSVALATIGIFLIASALPTILGIAVSYAGQSISRDGLPFPGDLSFLTDELLKSLFRLIIGVWLFLGSRGILGAGRMLRRAGLKEEDA